MTHRGPFQPLAFCDSVTNVFWADGENEKEHAPP